MKVSLPEKNKRPGVCYAFTREGVELPVVDISHPAFTLAVGTDEQRRMVEQFLKAGTPFASLPKLLRNLLLRFFLRGSVLARGIHQSSGTFMSGLQTYLLKLGPEMLGEAYAGPIDRRIATSLPGLSVRLRLQDMAELMADSTGDVLGAEPRRPLRLVNIAGGPAIDSLNALILLHQRSTLGQRDIAIDVLDRDEEGPSFGEAALAALSAGPLSGVRIAFHHMRYEWQEPSPLQAVLGRASKDGAFVICSSEGGLFEYGSDEEIRENLKILHAFAEVQSVVGSVTRADEPVQYLRQTNTAATRPRGLEVFGKLAASAGWEISRAIERPFSDQVLLLKDNHGGH
jgi:hypothetical protein